MTKKKKLVNLILACAVLFTQIFCVGGYGPGRITVEAAETTYEDIAVTNSDFSADLWAEDGSAGWSTTDTTWGASTTLKTTTENHVGELNYWSEKVDSTFIIKQSVELEAGTYQLGVGVLTGATGADFSFIFGDEESEAEDISGIADTTYQKEFTLAEDGTVAVGLKIDITTVGGWGYLDNFTLKRKVTQAEQEGYSLKITASAGSVEVGKPITLTAEVKYQGNAVTNLADAGVSLLWWDNTNSSKDWITNYDATGKTLTAVITPQSVGDVEIQATLQDGDGTELAKKTHTITVTEVSTAVSGELNVDKVAGLPEDFIMGMDISSIISLFDSGVTFKDWDGKKISNVTDFCKFLASNGITHIRVRVWNDPYDSNGKGYGGGNNDVAKAKTIADACEAAGIHMLVDFHCSDLWTDPGKQMVPKAWTGKTVDEKVPLLKAFITDSLNTIDPNKNTVDMVQVGNETTSGFIGETDVAKMCTLFSAGSEGVKAFNASTKVVIHVTNPEKSNVTKWAKNLSDNSVEYDIIATSYYPYWHGTLANLKSQFTTVKNTYGKDVMVAETSYAYTLEDSDGHDNTVRVGNNDDPSKSNCTEPFTVQGQATSIRNLINAVNEAGGLGVYYWEPAWLTVGDIRGLTGEALEAQKAANRAKWEEFGSGWAASYAAEYDADDAGKWYGGSAVDNEAMFYPDGTPTAGLHVWEYVKTGAVSNVVTVDGITNPSETIEQDGSYTLPATVSVAYNAGAVNETVTWADTAAEEIDTGAAGTTYIVSGKVHFSKAVTSGVYKGKTEAPVTYTLKVNAKNMIEDADDAGFEKGGNFTIGGSGISSIPSKDDPYAGSGSMHWYNKSIATGTVTYNPVIALEPGKYVLEIMAQGAEGDKIKVQVLDTDEIVLFDGTNETLAAWGNWKTPKVTFELAEATEVKVRVVVDMQAEGWGSADEIALREAAEEKTVYIRESTPDPTPAPTPSGSDSSGSGSSAGSNTTTVTKNPDGTSTTATVSAAVNSAGKDVEVTASVVKAEDGSVVKTEEVTVIKNPAKNTEAVVTVEKNAAGEVTAAEADVKKVGSEAEKGTKVTVSAAVTEQIKEAAGTDEVIITTTVTDNKGEEKYTISVNAADLVTGEKLQVVAVDEETGEYILVNAKNYKVNEKGNVTVTLPDGKDYVLLNTEEAEKVSDEILKTVKVKTSSKTVKAGKKTTIQLSSKLNMDNVKKVTYSTSSKSKATVNKNGKVTAKAPGTVKIKAKVTLNNGKTKTVTMTLKIK